LFIELLLKRLRRFNAVVAELKRGRGRTVDHENFAGKARLGIYCGDAAEVDRDKVHATVSQLAVEFFDKTLR
jgi:hypothetical protein